MQDTQLMTEGVALMGLGMGIVFVFLTVLVMITTLMSKIIGHFFPEPVAPPARSSDQVSTVAAGDDDLMAVISVAVHRYRQRR